MTDKNYLFIDGRYTLQAKIQSGKQYSIFEIPKIYPHSIFAKSKKKRKIGFDPNLFTYNNLKIYFNDSCDFLPLNDKFFDNKNINNKNKFYSLNKSIVGESSNSKITRVVNFLNKKKIENLFVSAGENVCWLLNIRGMDLPNAPVANCRLILTKDKRLYFFSNKNKFSNIKKKLKKLKILMSHWKKN